MKFWTLSALIVAFAGCGTSDVSADRPADAEKAAPLSTATSSDGRSEAVGGESGDKIRLSIVNFEGIQDHIARNRGRVVVMDAWSTSCPPCMKEFHHLVELHHKYGPEQLACISLSFDYEGLGRPEEQQDRVLKFLREQGAAFDNLMSDEESDVLYRKFKLAAVPAVFVYDRAGTLRKRFDNEQAKSKADAFTYEQVEKLVAELLKEETAGAESTPPSAP